MAALSNYFLQPAGLLGLSGLLALLVFYLVKKKPEEQVMPSMAFFMERKKEGKIQHAFRQILHNLMLLLQVLIVIGFAAALAHPYLNQASTAEQTVVILDNSASMTNDLKEAKQFAAKNLGQSNTVIVANEEPEVLLQDAQKAAARSAIQDVGAVDTGTDLSSAIRMAQNYEGQVVLASDLDDSYQDIDVKERLVEADREYKSMNTQPENSWGVTDVRTTQENISVDIKNFLNSEQEISYDVNENEETVQVPSNSVETVSFEPVDGRNTLELEEDGLEADNTAYTYRPSRENYEAVLISDSGNRYFEKALELIDFVDLEVVNPPVQGGLDADIYVVGNTDRVLTETLNSIEDDVRDGDSMIVFGQNGVNDFGLDSLPASIQGGWENATVEINRPIRTSLRTKIIDSKKTYGESLASPQQAIIKAEEGRGDVLFYNIDDKDFRSNFLYPVFWKGVLQDMTERPSIQERNIETGESLNASSITSPSGKESSGAVDEAGFYNTSRGVYAANLLNEDESSETASSADSSTGAGQKKKDVQNLVVVLLVLLMLGEVAYLRNLGEI